MVLVGGVDGAPRGRTGGIGWADGRGSLILLGAVGGAVGQGSPILVVDVYVPAKDVQYGISTHKIQYWYN